eukprot:2155790-Rhodomonas_salina.1
MSASWPPRPLSALSACRERDREIEIERARGRERPGRRGGGWSASTRRSSPAPAHLVVSAARCRQGRGRGYRGQGGGDGGGSDEVGGEDAPAEVGACLRCLRHHPLRLHHLPLRLAPASPPHRVTRILPRRAHGRQQYHASSWRNSTTVEFLLPACALSVLRSAERARREARGRTKCRRCGRCGG